MKVLFYLPVVTPFWFENMVEPLIRRMASSAEVHILAPKFWRNTGIGENEVKRCLDLPGLHWSLITGPEHTSLRTKPTDPAAVVDFVRDLTPDLTFCRSADVDTVAQFCGKVRFIMESGAAPFELPPHWTTFQDRPFDHGMLPDLSEQDWDRLEQAIGPAWDGMQKRVSSIRGKRKYIYKRAGIDPDRPLLLLPLEYEHEENFFLMHRVGAQPNYRLVAEIADEVVPDATLAVTNHPLNIRHVNNDALRTTSADLDGVVLVEDGIGKLSPTAALTPHAAAMLLGDSKTISLAAFAGTPIVRRSRFPTADWMNAISDLESPVARIESGSLKSADPKWVRRWFAFRIANDIFDPKEDGLTADVIEARMRNDVNPDLWEGGIARFRKAAPEFF